MLFWTLAAALLINLNGVVIVFLGPGRYSFLERLFVMMLAVLVVLAGRYPPIRALGMPGFLFFLTVALHNVIGTAVSFANDVDYFITEAQGLMVVGLIIVLAMATGAAQEAARIGIYRVWRRLLVLLTISSAAVVASPVYLIFPQIGNFHSYSHIRAAGTFLQPNWAGFMTIVTVLLALAMIVRHGVSKLPVIALVVGSLGTVMTVSRTAFMMLLLCYVAAAYLLAKKHRRRGVFFFVSGVSVAGLLYWSQITPAEILVEGPSAMLKSQTVLRITSTMSLLTGDVVRSSRWALAEHGLGLIRESPIVGHGMGTMNSMERSPYHCSVNRGYWAVEWLPIGCGVHNQYLHYFGEAGFLPMLTYILFLAVTFLICFSKPWSLTKFAVGGWITWIALFSVTAHTIGGRTWIAGLIGLSCGLIAYDQAARERNRKYGGQPLE